ncbi:MAG: RluA family pseudouridine synthase [Myxococcota bacterium]
MAEPGTHHADVASRSVRIPPEEDGGRVDEVLARLLGTSVRAAKRLCTEGLVRRGRTVVVKGDRVQAGQELTILEPHVPSRETPPLKLLVETPRYLVMDKPAGMASHRLRPSDPPSALDVVVHRFPEVATAGPDPREGGLLHRLDVGTSGALAFAREPRAFEAGRAAFKGGTARKLYLAMVHGEIAPVGVVEKPIAHHTGDPRQSVVVDGLRTHRGDPREARTRWVTLARRGPDALVLVDAEGGRRHQVRVHLAHAGAPLWGDELYGGPPFRAHALPGHALHAVWLSVPTAGETVIAQAAPPADWAPLVEELLGRAGVEALRRGGEAPLELMER